MKHDHQPTEKVDSQSFLGSEAEGLQGAAAPSPFFSSRQFYIIPDSARYQTPDNGLQESFGNSKLLPVADNSVHNNLEGQSPHRLERSGPKYEGISSELRERLLGKSPLRLVVSREPQFIPPATQAKYWIETLECSHQTTVYPDWYWDDGAHLIFLTPSAKRRRCQSCKDIALAAKVLPPKKPVQSVREVPDRKAGEL